LSATKNSISNFITKLAIYPIGFISSIIVARILGPQDRGVYVYILLLTSFLLPILTFGIGSGIIYLISCKTYLPKNVLFTVFLMGFIFGLGISGAIFLLWKFETLGETGKNIELIDLMFLLASVLTNSVFFFISRLLMGDSKFASLNWLSIIQGFANPILLLFLVWIMDLRLHGATSSFFLINLILCFSILIYAFRMYKSDLVLNVPFIKESFRYGIKGWFGDMAGRANLRFDQVILAAAVSPTAIGIYSVAVLLVELIWIIPDAIGPVLFNKIAAEKNIDQRVEITNKMNRTLIGISVILGILLALAAYFIILPFGYGSEYKDVIVPLIILIPGSILFIVAKVVTKLLSGSGNIASTSKAMVVGSVLTILFYIVLIPKFGIVGAAIGSSLGYASVSLACLYQYNKYHKVQWTDLFTFKQSDVTWIKEILFNYIDKLKLKSGFQLQKK
jgi:O-antigen/teichoic acid export membrane protein